MRTYKRYASIVSIAVFAISVTATGCSGTAQPVSGSASLEKQPLSAATMPTQIVDSGGQVWNKVGPIKYSTAKIQMPRTPSTGNPNANLPLEEFAARIRPKMDSNGVEYSLSWADTLALAAVMRKPPEIGQAPGGGPNGGPAPVNSSGLEGRTTGISGTDDRSQVFSSSYPWNNVGNYVEPNNSICTVFKLINNFTAVTARHCFMDGKNNCLSP